MSLGQSNHELLMPGLFAETYRIGNIVKKVYRKYSDDDAATADSIKVTHNEVSIYILLGDHPRIAKCLFTDSAKTYMDLKYYPHDDLKRFIKKYKSNIENAYLFGTQISRLEQWLLDETLNAHLSDFNVSKYDRKMKLKLEESKAMTIENVNYFLPKDVADDNTVKSNLFALGFTLFELITGKASYDDHPRESIEAFFREGVFSSVEGLLLGGVIIGC